MKRRPNVNDNAVPERDALSAEELLIEIGRALLMCQIVEKQFALLTKYAYRKKPLTLDELISDKPVMLKQLIDQANAMFQHGPLTKAFLRRFRDHRNEFVHSLIRVDGFSVSSISGRRVGAQYVLSLYREARFIQESLAPLVKQFARDIGIPEALIA